MAAESSHSETETREQVHETSTVPSNAAFRGHPIHPMLIPLPIGALVLSLVTDLVFVFGGSEFWAEASWWLLWAGIVSGVLAAAVGAVDYLTIHRVRSHRAGNIHLVTNVAVLALVVANLWIRAGDHATAITPAGVIITIVTVGLLGVSGWYGGELSYRHGVGVTGH